MAFRQRSALEELDRCRELVLNIPITTPNATHFGIQNAVNAVWNLQQNLRYLLHLHSEGQQQWQRRADKALFKRQTFSRRTNDYPTRKQRKNVCYGNTFANYNHNALDKNATRTDYVPTVKGTPTARRQVTGHKRSTPDRTSSLFPRGT